MTITERMIGAWHGLRLRRTASDVLGGVPQRNTSGVRFEVTNETETLLNAAYRESWFIRAYVDMPIDDMFARWREFQGANADAMRDAETMYQLRSKLSRALKNSRLYGTGLIAIIDDSSPPDQPLDPDRVRRGGLLNLLVSDRYRTQIGPLVEDPADMDYGKPSSYQIALIRGRLTVHPTRVVRFDSHGYQDQSVASDRWTDSPIIPLLHAAESDLDLARVVAYLSDEVSVKVVKIKGLRDKVARHGINAAGATADDKSVKEIVRDYNTLATVYSTTVADAEDEIARNEVNWGGLPQVQDAQKERMTAMSEMPATRLLGISPAGMNATGESDARNYAMKIAVEQHTLLDDALSVLDEVIARSAGLGSAPDYEFVDLLDFSEIDKAKALATLTTGLSRALQDGVIGDKEYRAKLDESGLVGALPGDPPGRGDNTTEEPTSSDNAADRNNL